MWFTQIASAHQLLGGYKAHHRVSQRYRGRAVFLRTYRKKFVAVDLLEYEILRDLTLGSSVELLANDPRIQAMLDVLGFTEGTGDDYGKVVNGTVISSPIFPALVGKTNVSVTDLSQHPNILVQVTASIKSTAAGRYQFLKKTWDKLGMPDFRARSQDVAAVKLLKQRGMIEPLLEGDVRGAVIKGAPEWASLPTASGGSYYGGQTARSITAIEAKYEDALIEHGG